VKFPAGYDLRVLQTVDSTNAEASRIVSDISGPTWILALDQTDARGRRGRKWHFPKGNFAATLVLQPREAPEMVALRSFTTSLALYDALITIGVRPETISLKWPNDVLLNGGKLAGILLESAGAGPGLTHLAIGIGVNLAAAPDLEQVETGATRPVSLLSDAGISIPPETFCAHLATHFATREIQFTTYGFDPIRTAWLDRAARIGDTITARTMQTERSGIFETVDAAGNLVLKTPQGREAIAAADIFF
jgi:BirA family biotin operon repressor/biotin-[acetyl-CoA-carboxylase] ligase